MTAIKNNLGFDQINDINIITCVNFIDDTFNVPIKKIKEILRMMIRKKYRFNWNSHFRCQYVDEETITLMKESGCEGVFLGIKSGNQQIKKKSSFEAIYADE